MGAGDEIMATAQARALRLRDERLVRILDRRGRHRWHELWAGNPDIAPPRYRGPMQDLRNGSGARPYIDYRHSTDQRWAFTSWKTSPGHLPYVKPDHRTAGLVIIEPTLKAAASPCKQWGEENWTALVATGSHRFAQLCAPGKPALRGVLRFETPTFRAALPLLAGCVAFVLPEGGLHHAAGALRKAGVVLFGSAMSPRNTGYDFHENLAVDDPEGLGWRIPNAACARAWRSITVDMVTSSLEKVLGPAAAAAIAA